MSLDAMVWAKTVKTGRSSAKAVLTWLADMCGADHTAYQVYSDGKGNYKALPLRDDQVLITRESHAEMSGAEPPKVIYNNHMG